MTVLSAQPKGMPSKTSVEHRAQISAGEWRFVLLTALAILIITSLPYLYGYLSAPPGRQFMGLMQDVPDHGQYLSWWRSFQSSLLVPNKLTPEPNRPLFFNLLWWLLAQISKFTGLGYPAVYQILRWGGGFALLTAVYRLLALLFSDQSRRKLAFLLIALSSGLGWILIVLKYTLAGGELIQPQLVFNAESNYFLCLLGFPHFALAAALICLIFEFSLRGWLQGRLRPFVAAGGWALLLGWMHAYDLLIIYGVLGAFFAALWLRDRKFPRTLFWGTAILGLMSGWAALYSFLLTSLDPLWKQVLAQFDNAGIFTPMPPLLYVLFGVPLFVATAGLVRWFRQKRWDDVRLFVAAWFFIGLLLLYIPTDFQIHMLNSWQIPMMILAADLLEGLAPRLARRNLRLARWLPAILLLAVIPTNLYLWTWRFVELARHEYPYYLETDYVRAADWLKANSRPEQVVLSSLTIGQYIPALSGNTAFLAHWANTVDFYTKEQAVAGFFNAAVMDDLRIQLTEKFAVDYVIAGPAERALGNYDPAKSPWLQPAFTSSNVTVYRVTHPQQARK